MSASTGIREPLDEAILPAIAEQLTSLLAASNVPVCFIGIANGGIDLAEALAARTGSLMKRDFPVGRIDISFHRDDINLRPIPKTVHATEVEDSLDGSHVILIDDVIASGRTCRAALNELFDLGRPERVTLVVAFDRGERMLPIQPDVVGTVRRLPPDQVLKLRRDENGRFHTLLLDHG